MRATRANAATKGPAAVDADGDCSITSVCVAAKPKAAGLHSVKLPIFKAGAKVKIDVQATRSVTVVRYGTGVGSTISFPWSKYDNNAFAAMRAAKSLKEAIESLPVPST